MQIHYLEIVTPEIDSACLNYEAVHGIRFGAGAPGLGGARTAQLKNGGMIGIRAPMSETEDSIVRPYLLVDDIEAAITRAEESGGEIAHPPLEIAGHGKFAIYIMGGNNHGLWQV